MKRIIIINGVPYICPKTYEVLNFIDASFERKAKVIPKNEQKEEVKSQNIYTFGSIYDGHLVSVKYIKIPTGIPLEIFFDNEQKITIYPNIIGIDMDPNSNQLWAFWFGVWYKVSGSPKEILDYIEKNQVVPLLYALQILSQNDHIQLQVVRKYILHHIQRLKGITALVIMIHSSLSIE